MGENVGGSKTRENSSNNETSPL